jgi:hypothetical protein
VLLAIVLSVLQLQILITPLVLFDEEMSSIPAHGKVYSIQHYVMKFVSDLVVSSVNKTDNHDITEILLKVALNTITLTLTHTITTMMVPPINL